MSFLLVDFGASRVKTALSGENPSSIKEFKPAPPLVSKDAARYEVSADSLKALFRSIIRAYPSTIDGILICSEMHGFILRRDDGSFATNYISWQDNRASDSLDGISTLQYISDFFPQFRECTGMRPKAGLPAINLLHLLRSGELQAGAYRMLSLPEIFGMDKAHSTMTAGFGVWDIYKNEPCRLLMDILHDYGCSLSLNPVTSEVMQAGVYEGIPVYTAVGDNQCALYGCGLHKNQLILNLGTGSQAAYIDGPQPNHPMEQRPYMDNQMLSIITHIPSGRALNCFMGFLQDCFTFCGSPMNAWDALQGIDVEDIEKASLKCDLAVFASAYGFSEGGSIAHIMEKNFTLREYTASLLKGYINQYINIINLHNLDDMPILLAGGIPQKLPVLKAYLQKQGKNIEESPAGLDETLVGLNKIAVSLI